MERRLEKQGKTENGENWSRQNEKVEEVMACAGECGCEKR